MPLTPFAPNQQAKSAEVNANFLYLESLINAVDSDLTTEVNKALISGLGFTVNGGGTVISTGVKGDLEVPFNCTINGYTIMADQSGSVVVDVWKDSYANFPPVDGDSITASAPITISSSTKGQDDTLTGWSKTLNKGDILRFNVDSCSTITRFDIVLRVTKI